MAATLVLASALVLGFGGWAATAKLQGAIVTHGRVAAKKQLKLIQHRDGGIVADILVANGDRVVAGDILVRLDETQTRSEMSVMKLQLAEYVGRRARLTAERSGAEAISFNDGFEAAAETASIAEGERLLFAQNRAMRDAQRDQLLSQVQQYEEQVRGMEAQRLSNKAEKTLVTEEMDRVADLLKKRLIEVTKVKAMKRDLTRIEGLGAEIDSNVARVGGQISEARLKIIELDQQMRTEAQRELRDVEARIAELNERLVASIDRLSRMEMRAPISGTVNDLAIHTVNGVIAPGETVMSIVPEGDELIVEARLSPADIDQVSVGQETRLRFSAFNQRTTPEILGTIAVVGAAATKDPATGDVYYLSSIAINDRDRALAGKPLIPGMPVEVFVTTAERTALSYLVKPFKDQAMRSLRED